MKKFIVIVLVIACCLSMASCGSSKKNIYFTAENLDGKTVYGDEIFKENEVTMVNIWATWCGPCVSELPELQKIYKEYKDKGVTIIGVCCDSNPKKANIQSVLNKAGVKYMIIYETQELNEIFPAKYIPTTYFVDSKGNIVGEPIVGADPQSYRDRLDSMLGK